jgi:hypothetical protein
MVLWPEQDEHLGRVLLHRRRLAVHVWQSVLANAKEFVRGSDDAGGMTSFYDLGPVALVVKTGLGSGIEIGFGGRNE